MTPKPVTGQNPEDNDKTRPSYEQLLDFARLIARSKEGELMFYRERACNLLGIENTTD